MASNITAFDLPPVTRIAIILKSKKTTIVVRIVLFLLYTINKQIKDGMK